MCLSYHHRFQGTLPDRTREFADMVVRAKGKEYQAMHPSKLTFQSLRVHINQVPLPLPPNTSPAPPLHPARGQDTSDQSTRLKCESRAQEFEEIRRGISAAFQVLRV